MAKIDLGNSFGNFFLKDIQRAYQFVVDFRGLNGGGIDEFRLDFHTKGKHNIEIARTLKKSHVKNVVLPQYQFESQGLDMGPYVKSFPVLQRVPLDLKIEMVEDEEHTIGFFIQYLQNQVMNEYGVYRPTNLLPTDEKLPTAKEKLQIAVTIVGYDGEKIATYTYYNCYIQSASEATYDYTSNDAITHNISFKTDYYGVKYYPKPRNPQAGRTSFDSPT